jgi:hypothetical protein
MKRVRCVTAGMQQHTSTFRLYSPAESFEPAIVPTCSDHLSSVGRKRVSSNLL